MSAPARLLALRLQGFKSFAERTVVEFGPGISAVVGPNGSGKSNLADALRWALGEQGRSLRIRKSEDVIFAGSERRAALGMADVTLVVDNADGLLPVEYEVLELGRRLYRSGENDYLLNRQRIRLRDLVDLLDGANLADNAFLFIGQGMVDQALSLRPEERRPLFEEVAGVRRHERRRRRAEDQLVEAEANLARVEDILGELRPQARRLSAQAQQQATRRDAGEELAAAIVTSAHARWHEAAGRAADAAQARDRVRAEADAAMAALSAAEDRVAAIAGRLQERAAREAELRDADDAARTRATELRLRVQRLESDLAALERDRVRAEREREAAEAELTRARRDAAVPVPPRDAVADSALSEADRALAEALAELASLQAADRAEDERRAAALRARAAARAERDQARRRADEATRLAAETRAEADRHEATRRELDGRVETDHAARVRAVEAEAEATRRAAAARDATEHAEAERSATAQRAAVAAEAAAALETRLAEAEARLAREADEGLGRAARRRGGRRLVDGLEVDPDLRAAVEAALGRGVVAYVVEASGVTALAEERGTIVVRERLEQAPAASGPADRARRLVARASAAGGGSLAEAVRLDPSGAARPLLERALWVPDLAAALALQPDLPPGWVIVPRDGRAVVGPVGVELGRGEDRLGRRSEVETLRGELERAAATLARQRDAAASATRTAETARAEAAEARRLEGEASTARREAEEVERLASRSLEAATREAAWHEAQAGRAEAEAARAAEALAALGPEPGEPAAGGTTLDGTPGPVADDDDASPLAAWEARVADLRGRRDRLAGQAAQADAVRRDAEARRVHAEAAATLAEERAGRAASQGEAIRGERGTLEAELAAARSDLAAAQAEEGRSREELAEVRSADTADRGQLAGVEREAAGARDRLRLADERLRRADVDDLETRLALDAIREGVLVELAGLGEVGLRALGPAQADPSSGAAEEATEATEAPAEPSDDASPDEGPTEADEAAVLERSLEMAARTWAAEQPAGEPPTPGRLGSLRRRFHELGAANPFAAEEYEEVRTRLDALETQQADLRTAIEGTRRLIGELDALITEQFRSTFRALETAFDERFQRLFGGGFARLSLTDPGDLSATGVEIVARPPGKKPQTLAMLSGGERALTAVALLFAMLEVRPVPFCVLDEVDAALDEANIGRFTESLVDLAQRTQFIVITHNRGTIESADALYGVTVGDDSVSRVISLRLDEAQALADAAAAPDGG